MTPSATTKVLLWALIVVAAVGGFDALVSAEWDFLATFGLVGLLSLVLVARLQSRRVAVPLRRDLVEWLTQRATASGERLETLTDRAIVAYRAGLVGDESAGPPVEDQGRALRADGGAARSPGGDGRGAQPHGER